MHNHIYFIGHIYKIALYLLNEILSVKLVFTTKHLHTLGDYLQKKHIENISSLVQEQQKLNFISNFSC